MRSIDTIKDEIKSLKESSAIMKWVGIANAAGAIILGIDMRSLAVFVTGMLGAMIFFAIWNGDVSRINRLEEEIEER